MTDHSTLAYFQDVEDFPHDDMVDSRDLHGRNFGPEINAQLKDAEGFEDWPYGMALIADHYFTTYAQDFAEEIGAIPDDAGWPCTCIDWDRAARDLQVDYTSVEIDGRTYWGR